MAAVNAREQGAGATRATGRLRVTARLAVELFVLAVLITAACAWTAHVLVDETFRRSLDDELRVMLAGAERAVEVRREGVRQSLARIEESLMTDPELLARFLTEDRGLTSEAGRFMNWFQLDFLEVLNAEGKILSCGHTPEQIGLSDPDYREIPEDRAMLVREKVSGAERGLLLLRREKRHGLRTLVLVGGVGFDRAFVEQVAGHEAAVFVEPGGQDEPPRAIRSASSWSTSSST